jgi:hypothetical protein
MFEGGTSAMPPGGNEDVINACQKRMSKPFPPVKGTAKVVRKG